MDWYRSGTARVEIRETGSKLRRGITEALARAHASAWSGIALRIALCAGGLLLLAWIGRAATAATPPSTAAPLADAGVSAPIAMPTAPPAVTSSPPIAADPPPPQASPSSQSRATAEDPVYLNQAGITELRRLPGVGAKRAEAIVALRQRLGRFQRAEELLRVKGVGRTTLRKWRPLLRFDSPAADAGTP
jgi:competence protein ComEA